MKINDNITCRINNVQKEINLCHSKIQEKNKLIKEQNLIIRESVDNLKEIFYRKWTKLKILKK